jgi:hypothetical protein
MGAPEFRVSGFEFREMDRSVLGHSVALGLGILYMIVFGGMFENATFFGVGILSVAERRLFLMWRVDCF